MSAGLHLLVAALMGSLPLTANLTGFQNDIYGTGCKDRVFCIFAGDGNPACVKYLSILILWMLGQLAYSVRL